MVEASREFQVFAKPAGPICNLDCHYCYYLKKEHLYPKGKSLRMSEDILEAYIVQHIDAFPGPVINFSWHGGEPTVLKSRLSRRLPEQPLDRSIRSASFGGPAGMFPLSNTMETSFRVTTSSTQNITWEIFRNPRWSHFWKVRHRKLSDRLNGTRYPTIVRCVRSWICAMAGARRIASFTPRMGNPD